MNLIRKAFKLQKLILKLASNITMCMYWWSTQVLSSRSKVFPLELASLVPATLFSRRCAMATAATRSDQLCNQTLRSRVQSQSLESRVQTASCRGGQTDTEIARQMRCWHEITVFISCNYWSEPRRATGFTRALATAIFADVAIRLTCVFNTLRFLHIISPV